MISRTFFSKLRISNRKKLKKTKVKRELAEELSKCEEKSALMTDFSDEEVYTALKNVKNGKVAETDEILLEFFKNLGLRSISWIAKFVNKIVNTNTLPKIWREMKVIAILKPNKETTNPKNYRPISLSLTMYKLFEKLILA
jgi:thermostable 8-oxoguanine DNA glycosylase